MSKVTCVTCRFLEPESEDGAWGARCRRYPPVLNTLAIRRQMIVEDMDPDDAADLRMCWSIPRVFIETDWCGEHQPEPSAEAAS